VYTGSFTVSQTTTVRFFSTDLVGNAEAPKSQIIQIDTVAPAVALTAPANGASFLRGAKVTISATASDAGSGVSAPSGVAQVAFYLDGTTLLGTDTSSPYSISWNTLLAATGTHVITAVATDAAGNTTVSAGRTITILL
jgi:hypothetical protein